MKMLQKLVVFAFVIFCIIGSVTHMNATANDETKIKLMAEKNFNYYIPSVRSNKDEFYLESDLVKVDFMVVGMQYNSKGLFGYWITPVNQMAGGLGVMYPSSRGENTSSCIFFPAATSFKICAMSRPK